MKFSALPVHAFEDVTLDLEQLQQVVPNALAVGAGVLTWPGGSAFSNTLTVNHGLIAGGTQLAPTCVQAFSQLPGGGAPVEMHYVSVSATQVQFRGHTTDGSSPLNTATTAFFWLAIG